MSFGKRNNPDARRSPRSYDEDERYESDDDGEGESASWLTGTDLLVALTIVIVGFAGGLWIMSPSVGFTGLSLGGFSLSNPFAPSSYSKYASVSEIDFSPEPAPRARSYDRTQKPPFVFPASQSMMVKYAVTPGGFDAIDSELHERCMKKIDVTAARYAEIEGKTHLNIRAASRYLACTMGVYRERFCMLSYRKRLISRLRELLRAKASVEALRDVSMANPISRDALRRAHDFTQMMDSTDDGIRSGDDDDDNIVDTRLPPVLGEALGDLSRAGYITQSDFGGGLFASPPAEYAPYLSDGTNFACR